MAVWIDQGNETDDRRDNDEKIHTTETTNEGRRSHEGVRHVDDLVVETALKRRAVLS